MLSYGLLGNILAVIWKGGTFYEDTSMKVQRFLCELINRVFLTPSGADQLLSCESSR